MGYENPNRRAYRFGQQTLVTTDKTMLIRGPKGKAGKLIDYGFENVTTSFVGGTTLPLIAIGISGTLEAYGKKFGAAASGAALNATDMRTLLTFTNDPTVIATYLVAGGEIPANFAVIMTLYAATGAGAAGVADGICIIDWAD